MLYKVFIDDSGSNNYKTPYSRDFIDNPPVFDAYEQFWRDNYFILCGIRIAQKDIGEINIQLNRLKERFFGTSKVEVKSDWLRNPHKRKKHYLAKFDISEQKLTTFVNELYRIVSGNRDILKIIATVFDKRFYGDKKRQSGEGNPLIKSSQVIFERLQYLNTYHIVVFDQMESSLKVDKGSHGKILRMLKHHEGMDQIFVAEYDKIADIVFERSSHENFLQLADLCAYNIYRQFVHYGRQWCGEQLSSDGKLHLDMYSYFNKIRCNFIYLIKKRKVCGVGLICIPDRSKLQWDILKDCDL